MFRSLLCVIALASSEGAAYSEQTVRVLDANVYHLGTPGFPEWEEFAKSQAHGRRLDIQFKAEPNSTPQILFIRQRQVKARWVVLLNNQRLGNLLNIDSKLVHSITVPPGKLKAGLNTLSIAAPSEDARARTQSNERNMADCQRINGAPQGSGRKIFMISSWQ